MSSEGKASLAISIGGRIAFAVIIVASATALKLLIGGWAERDEDVLFLAAVALVAWGAGARAGVLAVVLSGLSQAYFFLPPRGFGIADPGKAVALGVWVLEGNLLCLAVGRLDHLRLRAVESAREAQQREQFLRRVFEETPTPMFVVTRDTSSFLEANDAALALYGYEREKLLRMSMRDLRARPGSADEETSVSYARADGTILDIELTATAASLDGKPVRIVIAKHRNAEVVTAYKH
jgi:PAS domain S-box-containing protein